jgi:hypothetical protein
MQVIKTHDGKELLMPKNDYFFKQIFGDKRNNRILKCFLQDYLELGEEEFEVHLLDTHPEPGNRGR